MHAHTGYRYFREMNRSYSKSNFLNKYELRPEHVEGSKGAAVFADSSVRIVLSDSVFHHRLHGWRMLLIFNTNTEYLDSCRMQANSLNRDSRKAEEAAASMEVTDTIAALTPAEVPAVRDWVSRMCTFAWVCAAPSGRMVYVERFVFSGNG